MFVSYYLLNGKSFIRVDSTFEFMKNFQHEVKLQGSECQWMVPNTVSPLDD